jgi:hypothetical protein
MYCLCQPINETEYVEQALNSSLMELQNSRWGNPLYLWVQYYDISSDRYIIRCQNFLSNKKRQVQLSKQKISKNQADLKKKGHVGGDPPIALGALKLERLRWKNPTSLYICPVRPWPPAT